MLSRWLKRRLQRTIDKDRLFVVNYTREQTAQALAEFVVYEDHANAKVLALRYCRLTKDADRLRASIKGGSK